MTKRPCSSLSAERDNFVPTSVAVIFTPGTSAPEGSETVPATLPKPCPKTELGVMSNTAKMSRRPMVSSVGYAFHMVRYCCVIRDLRTTLVSPAQRCQAECDKFYLWLRGQSALLRHG